MSNCVFCKIIEGSIPSTKVYEDQYVVAFRDINPQAPCHIVITPRFHVDALHNIPEDDLFIMAALFSAVKKVVAIEGLAEKGYRVVMNSGEDGGQTVDHIHLHLLGKRSLAWPPG